MMMNGSAPDVTASGRGGVWQLMRQDPPAGKEPQERSALFTTMITDRPTQDRIRASERVQHGVLRSLAFKVELHSPPTVQRARSAGA